MKVALFVMALCAFAVVMQHSRQKHERWTINRSFLVWEDEAHERFKARIPKSVAEKWLKGACEPGIHVSSIFYSPYRGIDIRLDCDK